MTATFRDGRKTHLKLTRAGTTMILSSGMDDSEFARAVDTHEVTVYGQDDKRHVSGLRGATLKGSGPYASTFESFLSGCLGSTANPTFGWSPLSTVAPNPFFTGSLIVTDYTISAPLSGRVAWSIDTIITGAVTSTKHT